MLGGRRAMLDKGIADWAMGEAFAFGSLLEEGFHVRYINTCRHIDQSDHSDYQVKMLKEVHLLTDITLFMIRLLIRSITG